MKKITLSLLFLCTLGINAQVYVKPATGGGDDANNGLSWNTAKATVAAAIPVAKAATAANKNIFVKQGTYNETWGTAHNNTTIGGVSIYGGFEGTETSIEQRAKVANGKPWEYVNQTIITFTSLNNGFGCNNTVAAGNTVIIDGFSFQDMTAATGAGIAFRDNVTVQNCVFKNNTIPANKHLVNPFVTGTVGPGKLLNCYFYNNTVDGGNIITCNIGASSAAIIDGCVIVGNRSTHRMINAANATKISNCILFNNTTGIEAALDVANATGEVVNCLVFNNTCHTAVKIGGKAVNLTVANNKITTGNAVSLAAASAKVYNTVVVGNLYQENPIAFGFPGVTAVAAEVKNCAFDKAPLHETIVAANNQTLANLSAAMFVSPSDVVGEDPAKNEIFAATNWRTQTGSPLIDSGDNTFFTESFHGADLTDLDGKVRINNIIIDMGAYEYDPSIGVTETATLSSLFTANGQVIIHADSPLSVEIYSISGIKVASSQAAKDHAIKLSKGSYIVVGRENGNQTVNKVMIQ